MTEHPISDEQLNAFLDNQLDEDERAHIMERIQADKGLASKLCELRQVKEMTSLAYSENTVPKVKPAHSSPGFSTPRNFAIAVSIALCFGFAIGLLTNKFSTTTDPYAFYLASEIQADSIQNNKILMHIDTMDSKRVHSAIVLLEQILLQHRQNPSKLRLEVVANSEGINFLKSNSPYADRIRELANHNQNVSFLACGIAMQRASIAEGEPVQILPDARRIDAAIKRILSRVNDGWAYIKS